MKLVKIKDVPCAECGGEVPEMKSGGWIGKASKSIKERGTKGKCTPITKPGCTGRAKALAKTFKKIAAKRKKKHQDGGFVQDDTGLGTYLYDEPVEMNLDGVNPIVGGPMDVFAQDELGQNAFIPAGATTPTFMYGNVKEIPMMKKGGETPITVKSTGGIGNYNNKRPLTLEGEMSRTLNEPSQPDITSTLKSIDKEDANIEAEKGELVLKPDGMGLYKVGGQTHAEGGTHLNLDPGSFIYSNDPTLKITKDEIETFDFKDPSSYAKSKNTPAKVLQREVNPKEYNSHIDTITSNDTDHIAKTTAALMLEKYQKKLGQVAYLQESKKDAPIPDFAMGSAPFIEADLKEDAKQEPMYAKKGGKVKGYQTGGMYYPGAKTSAGRFAPRGQNNQFSDIPAAAFADQWRAAGIDIAGKTPRQFQQAIYDWTLQNDPQQVKDLWQGVGLTNLGRKNLDKIHQLGIKTVGRKTPGGVTLEDFADASSLTNDQLVGLRDLAYADNLLGYRTFLPQRSPQPATVRPVQPYNRGPIDINIPVTPQTLNPGTPEQPNIPSLGYDIRGKLTPAQMAHLSTLGLNALSINRYFPKRDQVELPEVDLNTINAQPYLNNVNNQAFMAYDSLNASDPRAARVNAAQIYGRGLDSTSQILGNIDNQNKQIQNQENLTNLQQRTQQVLTNTQLDSKYYDQVQTTKENFDRERRYANNQFVSTLNQYQSQDDALAWGLASQYKYGRRLVTDPRTGKQYYKPTPLFEYTGNGIRYNADVADLNLATGADRLNSVDEAAAAMTKLGINPQDPKQVYAFSRFIEAMSGRGKNPVYQNNPLLPQ